VDISSDKGGGFDVGHDESMTVGSLTMKPTGIDSRAT
jgi:hypothetical protein